MNNVLLSLFLLVITSPIAIASDLFKGQWIDLTHVYSEETIYWPTSEQFTKTTVFHGHTQNGYFYTAYNFAAPSMAVLTLMLPSIFTKTVILSTRYQWSN